MRVLGIDPGLTGAIALLTMGVPPRHTLSVQDMPTAKAQVGDATKAQLLEGVLVEIVRELEPDHAFVELVHAMPKQGVSSTFTFGMGFGIVRGVLAGLGVPTTLITPQSWGRAVQLPRGDGGSRIRACQLFPAFAGNFARVKDHGRADAALIALAGWRSLNI